MIQPGRETMRKDYYRDWTYQDRQDAYREGDYVGCRRYDEDRDSSDRAYENWRNGGDFQDPETDNRFS
jgi:hypothetical protein